MSYQNQNNQEEGLEEAATRTNPVEGIAIMEAPAAEAETGAALDAAIVESNIVGVIMT